MTSCGIDVDRIHEHIETTCSVPERTAGPHLRLQQASRTEPMEVSFSSWRSCCSCGPRPGNGARHSSSEIVSIARTSSSEPWASDVYLQTLHCLRVIRILGLCNMRAGHVDGHLASWLTKDRSRYRLYILHDRRALPCRMNPPWAQFLNTIDSAGADPSRKTVKLCHPAPAPPL